MSGSHLWRDPDRQDQSDLDDHGWRKDLTDSDCEVFFDTPRWVDEDTLVAVRVTKDPGEELGYDLDIVSFDVATGAMTEVVTEGNPCCLGASPVLGRISFAFSDRDGFSVYDIGSATTVDFPGEAYVPHLSGESRL